MADYRVIFFNNLVNSYGKSFKCLQRALSQSARQMTQKKRQKKQNANLGDWRMSPIGKPRPIPRGGELAHAWPAVSHLLLRSAEAPPTSLFGMLSAAQQLRG